MANSNNMSTNHTPFHFQPQQQPQPQPHPHPRNPQFTNIPSHHQLPFQNIQMGMPQPQFFPHNMNYNPLCQPQGQFFPNNHPQVMNMPGGGQFNFHHVGFPLGQFPQQPIGGQFPQQPIAFPQINPFNLPPCMHPAMGAAQQPPPPQAGSGSQNISFQMNLHQPGMMNSHPAQCQNSLLHSPISSQQPPLSSLNNGQTQLQQPQNNLPSNNFGRSQGNHANDNGSNISNTNQRNPQGNDFTRNQQESAKKDSRNTRFQKFNVHTNAKGNFKSFKGRGSNDKGAKNPQLTRCAKQETSVESKRSLPLNYTEEEIKKWREERRKNHPSRLNTEKNSEDQTHNEDMNNELQKRRQQLKEILAKQAELGVEVAEIPRDYLLDSENKVNESGQNGTSNEKGRFKKRGGRRQKRGGNNHFNKKQKIGDSESSPRPAVIKKNPTLLQKLLSADIKKDKSHLLQAFRFMVLNNFFVDLPKKPLEFPSVTVKETPPGSDVGKGSSPHQKAEVISRISEKDMVEAFEPPNGNHSSHEDVVGGIDVEDEDEDMDVKDTDCILEGNSGGEEGEITD